MIMIDMRTEPSKQTFRSHSPVKVVDMQIGPVISPGEPSALVTYRHTASSHLM